MTRVAQIVSGRWKVIGQVLCVGALRVVARRRIVAFLSVLVLTGCQSGASTSTGASGPDELFDTIRAQEVNFPLPSTDATVTVGTVTASQIWDGEPSGFNFAVPTYSGSNVCVRRGRYVSVCTPSRGGVVTVANVKNLTLRFVIDWSNLEVWCLNLYRGHLLPGAACIPSTTQVAITINVGSQSKAVAYGTTEVSFPVGADITPPLSISICCRIRRGGDSNLATYRFNPQNVAGLLPVNIDRKLTGAGAITIPVIPVSIIYAPVVDAQKKNQATAAISSSTGNTTSVAFTTSNGATVPVPATFDTTNNIAKDMSAVASVLKAIPAGPSSIISGALSTIASGLGSSTGTQTDTNSVTTQHSLSVINTTSEAQTALSSEGGPGAGDLITYYYDAKTVWYSDGSAMRLAILGYGGLVQVTAGTLKNQLAALQGQPAGAIDASTHLDADSIRALLELDPFVKDGPNATLQSPRFVLASDGAVVMNGGTLTYNAQHQITQTDLNTKTTTTTRVETDNAGFLAFLGLGVTDTRTLQSQISQSSSTQIALGKTVSQSYVLNGNGTEFYACEVYFDTVFGSFAFRDVTSRSAPQ